MATTRPNLLLLLTDQHRPDWLGMVPGCPVRTPNMARLAREGAWFTDAVTPAPVCAAARACLAAGVEYDRSPVSYAEPYPLDEPTYYRTLRDDAGYHVLTCGKLDLRKSEDDSWGVDGTRYLDAYGFSAGVNSAGKWDAVRTGAETPADPYMQFLHEEGLAAAHVADYDRRRSAEPATFPTPLPDRAYADNWIARRGLDLLADAPSDRPWHLVVNFNGPHSPWDVTEEMHGLYRNPAVDFTPPTNPGPTYDPDDHQEICRNYAAMIENIDRWLGRYLATLDRRGELAETVIVVASDHGEMLGDHGEWAKRAPFRASAGVPLLVRGPDVTRRGRFGEPASLIDLHATFLDYAGVDEPNRGDSRSLRPFLAGATDEHREVVFSGLDPWRLVSDGRFSLVSGCDFTASPDEQVKRFPHYDEDRSAPDTPVVLFDRHRGDETEDVSAEHPDVVDRLSDRLAANRADG